MRHGRLFVIALLCSWITLLPGAREAAAQGACSELEVVACDTYLSGSTLGQPNLLGGPAGEMLYLLETGEEMFYGFSLTATMPLAPGLTLYEGCALEPGAQILASGTTFYSTNAELTALLPANSTFTLLVEGATREGNFDLSVWCLNCNPGECTGITESEPNSGPLGGLYNAVTCEVPVCGSLDAQSGQPDEDWFVLELTEDAAIYCSLLPGGFDPVLELHYGLNGAMIQQSDFIGICYSEGIETTCLPAGTYSFRVAESTGQLLTGAAYQLFLGCNPCTWVDPLSNCQAFQYNGELTQFVAAEEGGSQADVLRAEHFGHGGLITVVEVAGIQFSSANQACTDPQFRVTLYEDGAEPGLVVGSWIVTGTPTPTGDIFFFGLPVQSWLLPLPAPVQLESGFLAVQGVGDPDCAFGWGRSPGADDAHLLFDGIWGYELEDLNFCLTLAAGGTCPAPTDLQVSMAGQDALLSWSAVPEAASYQVFSSTTGYGPWSLLGGSATPSYLDPAAEPVGRRFYQVRSVCP